MNFTNIVGVQFRRAGKIYDFLPGELALRVGERVVVDTERGATVAEVVRVMAEPSTDMDLSAIKPVIRRANDRDLDTSSHFSEEQSLSIARSRVEAYKLDMRVMKAESQMGGNKIIVYFSSPGRVDFRDLVKDLASALRARVELKQVGARDEAKLVGGLGICGREYCCSSFLRDFVPVSIKMAKNQNLALNPNKVSGGCGRLLCCLTYENDAYVDLRKRLPPIRSRVRNLADGDSGSVIKTDILNQLVVFETADGRLISSKVTDIEIVEKSHHQAKDGVESEADVWADDIDLSLLMGEGDKGSSSQNAGSNQRPQQKTQNSGSHPQKQRQDRNPQNQRNHNQGREGYSQRDRSSADRGKGSNNREQQGTKDKNKK